MHHRNRRRRGEISFRESQAGTGRIRDSAISRVNSRDLRNRVVLVDSMIEIWNYAIYI